MILNYVSVANTIFLSVFYIKLLRNFMIPKKKSEQEQKRCNINVKQRVKNT